MEWNGGRCSETLSENNLYESLNNNERLKTNQFKYETRRYWRYAANVNTHTDRTKRCDAALKIKEQNTIERPL